MIGRLNAGNGGWVRWARPRPDGHGHMLICVRACPSSPVGLLPEGRRDEQGREPFHQWAGLSPSRLLLSPSPDSESMTDWMDGRRPRGCGGLSSTGKWSRALCCGVIKGSVRGSTRTLNTWVQEGAYRTYVR